MLKGDHFVKHCKRLPPYGMCGAYIDLCSGRVVRLRMKSYS